MFEKRINIFTGHFGSGKTEVAVNYALKMAEIFAAAEILKQDVVLMETEIVKTDCAYRQVAIMDFDIVNPYFRTVDAKKFLEQKGIRVVVPRFANTNVDIPALPAEINTLFDDKNVRVVFDVGGDPEGARALACYHDEFSCEDYEMFLVVNIKRKVTETPEGIAEMIREIEASSRLKVTALVNNANLLGDTTPAIVEEGRKIVSRAAELAGVRFAFTSIIPGYMDVEYRNVDMECFKGDKAVAACSYGKAAGEEILSMERLIKHLWE